MEKAKGTLKDYIKNNAMNFELFEKLFKSLSIAIQHIHDNDIIHRDLKPENIFMKEKGTLAIGDFDIAKFSDIEHIKFVETGKSDRLANYNFSAPEQSLKNISEITTSSDWFAFGQILYWLITKEPLRGQQTIDLRDYDKKYHKYHFLIESLLQQSPNKRPQNLKEIDDVLESWKQEEKEYIRQKQYWDSLELFNNIINKYSIGTYSRQFKKIINKKEINNLMKDLAINCDKLDLWWSQGYADYNLKNIEKLNFNSIDKIKSFLDKDSKWVVDSFELDIESIWIYKYGEVGGDIIIVESKAMPSFGIYDNSHSFEEVALFQNRYILRSHYDDGYTEINGKKIKIDTATIRIRHLYKDIFFITPCASPIIGERESEEIIYSIVENYRKIGLLNEEVLSEINNIRRSSKILW